MTVRSQMHEMLTEEYRVYKARWFVWATAVSLNCFANASWIRSVKKMLIDPHTTKPSDK